MEKIIYGRNGDGRNLVGSKSISDEKKENMNYDYCMSSCMPFAESYGIHRKWYCKAHCQNVMGKYKAVAHIDLISVTLDDDEDDFELIKKFEGSS